MTEERSMSRRRFLAIAGGTIGATALACGGLTVLSTQQADVDFIESSCGGENGMSKKVLVAYASKCGSTGEVAAAVGDVLCNNGTTVDVRLVKEVSDVSAYDGVIVGSAIRMGQWLPEAVKFVETHQGALSQRPVAYLAVCMTLEEDTEENRQEVMAYLDPVREVVEPVDVGLFAGAMDYSKLSLPFRLVMKGMKVPEGDFRNWAAIRNWAATIGPKLVAA